MTPWKYTDSTHLVVFQTNGSVSSCLVTAPEVQAWVAQGNTILAEDPLTPAQVAAAAQVAKDTTDAAAAKIDALVIAVMGLSPSQIDAMVDNRFPTLTASQRDYLKGLGKVVCVLARRL